MKILYSSIAVSDLEHLKEYISYDSPSLANSFILSLFKSIEKLSDFPKIGRVVPEFKDENIREIIFKTYRVIYKVFKDHVYILTIHHGAKILKDSFNSDWEN